MQQLESLSSDKKALESELGSAMASQLTPQEQEDLRRFAEAVREKSKEFQEMTQMRIDVEKKKTRVEGILKGLKLAKIPSLFFRQSPEARSLPRSWNELDGRRRATISTHGGNRQGKNYFSSIFIFSERYRLRVLDKCTMEIWKMIGDL